MGIKEIYKSFIIGDIKNTEVEPDVDAWERFLASLPEPKDRFEEAYNKYQSVELIAYDKAGNQSAPYVVNIQVTQNLFRLFWGNTLAKIISASVLLVLFIFFIILLKRRKDKKDEAEGR